MFETLTFIPVSYDELEHGQKYMMSIYNVDLAEEANRPYSRDKPQMHVVVFKKNYEFDIRNSRHGLKKESIKIVPRPQGPFKVTFYKMIPWVCVKIVLASIIGDEHFQYMPPTPKTCTPELFCWVCENYAEDVVVYNDWKKYEFK